MLRYKDTIERRAIMGRVINRREGYIDYRLNLLGIRVREGRCELIGRQGEAWQPIGAPRELPVEIPQSLTAVERAADELRMTAWQYQSAEPGSDLADVLMGRVDIRQALGGG